MRAEAGARSSTHASELAARKFLIRLAQLDLDDLGSAIHRWQHLVSSDWFDAETALSHAMHESNRYDAQESWLEEIATIFRRRPWFTRAEPGAEIGASDASGQYVATIATLALLVRDHLGTAHFKLLYEPFVQLIPIEETERE